MKYRAPSLKEAPIPAYELLILQSCERLKHMAEEELEIRELDNQKNDDSLTMHKPF